DQTPVSQPPLPDIVVPSVVENNYSPHYPVSYNVHVDDVHDSTELIGQERNSSFSFGPLLYPVPMYLLNDIYGRGHDREKKEDDDDVLKYLKIRTHDAPAKDGGDTNKVESGKICAICQSEFEHEENIGTLQCGHEYHVDCVKKWLLNKKDCPMCRASVLPSQE
ncbi:hypothetical protein HAX54_041315, partial [Datura stramonium]|nr:hypothetical protein [Datura stramonium]